MSCLGERLTALVDGELDHDERDRALAHLAVCRACRQEADMMRRIKDRLRSLAVPAAGSSAGAPDLPDEEFLSRLRALGQAGGPPADIAWNRPSQGAVRPGRPAVRPLAPVPARRRVPRRYLAVGAAAMMLGLGSASYVAGGRTEQPPAVVPAFDRLQVEHALTNGMIPAPEPSSLPAAP